MEPWVFSMYASQLVTLPEHVNDSPGARMLVEGSNTPCLRDEISANSRLLAVKLRQHSVCMVQTFKIKAIANGSCYIIIHGQGILVH